MAISRKSYHEYPKSYPQPEIYVPSFFLDVPFDNQIVHAEVRPIPKDRGYFTVTINHVFLAHIHKVGEEWYDFLGTRLSIYRAVGEQIDDYLKNLVF